MAIAPNNTQRVILRDGENNKIIIEQTGKVRHIYLQLKKESRRRRIGTINMVERRLYVNRRRGVHLLIKANAYGFNDYILKNGRLFDHILLTDETGVWNIPVKNILADGKYLWFNKVGFEKQIFVTLEQLREYSLLQ